MNKFIIKHKTAFIEYTCGYIATKINIKKKLFSTIYELELLPDNISKNKIECSSYEEASRYAGIIYDAIKNNRTLIELK